MDHVTPEATKSLYRIGGTEAYFAVYLENPTAAALGGDLLLLMLIGLYLGTSPAVYVALRRQSPVYVALATLLTVLAVGGAFATESTFALLHLGERFVTAGEAQRAQLIAAAEAVIASDLWNSSAGYTGGILLQGSGVMISFIMLRSKDFGEVAGTGPLPSGEAAEVNRATRTIVATVGVVLAIGGGIAAQVMFAPFACVAASRIHKPVTWWRKVLPAGLRPVFAKLWPVTLTIGSISPLIGLFIGITGYVPGVTDDESILAVCWAFVFGGGLGFYLLSFVAGFAHDVERSDAG